MAFNDCVRLREEKDETGRNLCPYSPATSFECPYGSTESASAYCPKYSNQKVYSPEGGMGGHYCGIGGSGGDSSKAIVIEYVSDPDMEKKVPTSIDYLKKAHWYLGKAIELMEKENSDE